MNHAMHSLTVAFFQLLHIVLDVYMWVVIVAAALLWLIAFKIVDKKNGGVKRASELLGRFTDPFLNPIRRVLKPVGGFDLTPVVLLFIVFFLQSFVNHMQPYYDGGGYSYHYYSSSSSSW